MNLTNDIRFKSLAAPILGMVVLANMFGCAAQNRTADKLAQDTASVEKLENSLTFNDVTLEQANAEGQPVWKVNAKQAVYSKDQKVAQVQNPTGQLFQDGKAVYQITGQRGEIQQDGKQLVLKGQIVATDPRHNIVLRGNELEWRPQEDLLIVRNQLTGNHPKIQVVAQEARAFSRKQRVELQGKVVANTKDPTLQIRTEQIIWEIVPEKLIGDRPLAIDRYTNKKITGRATANAGEVSLKTKVITLKQNAQVALVEPLMQLASNHLLWNTQAQTLTSNQPVRVVHHKEQMTVTGKQGWMDLQKQIVYLTGDVYGIGQKGQSLKSQAMTWYIPNQLVEANGAVVYRQVQPPVSFTGQKAVGKLQDQSVVVTGGGSERVVTEIIP